MGRPSVYRAVALAVLAACTAQATDAPPNHLDISATPTVKPVPPRVVNANAFTTRTPIKHVVFVVKENRTFDDLFGTFPGANGVSFGMDMGTKRPLIRGTAGRLPSDIPHCYRCAIQAWDHGKMDGFDQPPTELLALGGTERPLRRFLLLGVGPFVPEPPLHDRGAVRRSSR